MTAPVAAPLGKVLEKAIHGGDPLVGSSATAADDNQAVAALLRA